MKLFNLDFIEETERRQSSIKGMDFTEKTATSRSLEARKKEEKLKEEERERDLSERLDTLSVNKAEPFDFAKERIIGNNDLVSINYLTLGYIASRAVCRIHVKNFKGGNEGYGTGFLITPNLLLTNNHILVDSGFAVNSFAEFNYEYNLKGSPANSIFFDFDPEKFFYTNKELDYTVVAIKSTSKTRNRSISEFGYLKLSEERNTAVVSEYVSIIQHPGGGYKQIAIRENEVLTKNENFITYMTDTAQGSSGSPVFNDQWQVVALHHSGVPKRDSNRKILCKDGSIFKEGMDDSLIDWISNEGINISAILGDLKSNINSNNYVDEIFVVPEFKIAESTRERSATFRNEGSARQQQVSVKDNKITFTIPIEISFGIGSSLQLSAGSISAPQIEEEQPDQEEEVPINYTLDSAINDKYGDRKGYDENFVKAPKFKIKINDLLKKQTDVLAPIYNQTSENKHLLHYFNFSVAINKHRRLCLLTAVNIHGEKLESNKRENTKWILDPRMDEKYQTGPEVYANNDLDRGHMVRRLDPVWGDNADAANDDTFHFTNSAPQHMNLNRKTWLSLEDYILKNAGKEGVKVSVFTGPVFSEDDIPYRGVLLPLEFWKVAVVIKENGEPSVTGYMLKQPDNIEDFRIAEGIREDGFGQFKTYQVPIQKIASLTGLAFDKFKKYDPMAGVDFKESANLIEITGPQDIKL